MKRERGEERKYDCEARNRNSSLKRRQIIEYEVVMNQEKMYVDGIIKW